MRLRRILRPAVATFVCCYCIATAGIAIASENDVATNQPRREMLLRAHACLESGQLLEAEGLFRDVLGQLSLQDQETTELRTLCIRQLFDIYYRLGHFDKAIQFGIRCRESQAERDDIAGLRITDLRIGECYFTLAHHAKAKQFVQRALAVQTARPLSPVKKMHALKILASLADLAGDHRAARRGWIAVEEFGSRILQETKGGLPLRDRVQLGRDVATALRVNGKSDDAITQLNSSLALLKGHQYNKGRRDVLVELAVHYRAAGNGVRATQCLRAALQMESESGQAGVLSRADILSRLSSVLREQNQLLKAEKSASQAAAIYRDIIAQSAEKRHDSLDALNAFWKLKDLYRQTHQFRQAVELVSEQPWKWTDESLLTYRLKSEQGALHAAVGSYRQARELLAKSLEYRRRQNPLNLSQLPRTLNNLALVEQAIGNQAQAQSLCDECIGLYETYGLPADRDLAEAHNLLGTGAALEARYSEAVASYRRGIAISEKLGSEADGHRSNLILNLAKTYKSQGQYEAAIEQCRAALEIYHTLGASESQATGIAAVYCALATMHIAQEDFDSARDYARRSLALCEERHLEGGPLVPAAQHCLAIVHLVGKDYENAEKLWQAVLEQQTKNGQRSLTARTLNYLGAAAQLQGDLAAAESHYRRALAAHEGGAGIYPVMRFVSLWRLAQIRYGNGDETESRELLNRAISIAEATRVGTYGAEQQRADFFAQFAPAFDAAFHLSLREGDFGTALTYAERGRSRTFLDQLQLAGIDPRNGLKGTPAESLLAEELVLKRRINKIRSQAQHLAQEENSTKLETELRQTQQDYANVWHEILNASPTYRDLLVQNIPEWKQMGPTVVPRGSVMLYYYLGRSRGYLLLIGDDSRDPEVFMLEIPAGYQVPSPRHEWAERSLAGTRGIARRRTAGQDTADRIKVSTKPLPLNRRRARLLVDAHLQNLMLDGVAALRGIKRTRETVEVPPPPSDETVLTDILLPPEVRERIRLLAPDRLIVVPDGALHNLPIEALVLSTKSARTYVLDELPPISYAPSAGVLARLMRHSPHDVAVPTTILTVGDPAYSEEGSPERTHSSVHGSELFLGFRGQVERLPMTAEESRRVAALFDESQVTSLRGAQATEAQVVRALAGKRYLHFATHAFVDRTHGNLMGGILLTPPRDHSAAQIHDGILSLNEIYTLPLNHCELAVLSACETNVGPDGAQEAGFSLARAFFKAGVRRVVASHWTVEDESTAELMGTFFAEISGSSQSAHSVDYARALQTARRRVRQNPRWSHPFFWAPFVLIGPAVDRPPSAERAPGNELSRASQN